MNRKTMTTVSMSKKRKKSCREGSANIVMAFQQSTMIARGTRTRRGAAKSPIRINIKNINLLSKSWLMMLISDPPMNIINPRLSFSSFFLFQPYFGKDFYNIIS